MCGRALTLAGSIAQWRWRPSVGLWHQPCPPPPYAAPLRPGHLAGHGREQPWKVARGPTSMVFSLSWVIDRCGQANAVKGVT
jgi:hypothetical protein